jgi:hypothetical protein
MYLKGITLIGDQTDILYFSPPPTTEIQGSSSYVIFVNNTINQSSIDISPVWFPLIQEELNT